MTLQVQLDAERILRIKERLNTFHTGVTERLQQLDSKFKGPLHEGQIPIARALFIDDIPNIFVQCGRNYGKTEVVLYIVWRYAIMHPRSIIYIFAPERKQAKEIYWSSRRLQDYGPKDFIDQERDSELRLVFRNGSFICIDGSDNAPATRGVKPDLICYDEFQDIDPDAYNGMRPNAGAKRAATIHIGTPPDREGLFTSVRQEFLDAIKRGSKKHFYIERPTASNPYFDKQWLAEEERRLALRGESNIFRREYLAQYVQGGASSIFPMFNKDTHVRPIEWIQAHLRKDAHKLQYFTVFDPGTTSCFAVALFAYNQYTGHVFLLDEIYEQDRARTSTLQIWERAAQKEAAYYAKEPRRISDEAAAWFINEMSRPPIGKGVEPTNKHLRSKEDSISVIKDALLAKKFYVASHCEAAIKEMTEYHVDKNGEIVKKNDHLVDCIQYFFSSSGWSLGTLPINTPSDDPRFSTPAEDLRFRRLREDEDWYPGQMSTIVVTNNEELESDWW